MGGLLGRHKRREREKRGIEIEGRGGGEKDEMWSHRSGELQDGEEEKEPHLTDLKSSEPRRSTAR